MNTLEQMKLLQLEMDNLNNAVCEYEKVKKALNGERPYLGAGYASGKYVGLPTSATATAIERKIITIREHLNELRKLVR